MRDGLTINVDVQRLLLALEQNRDSHAAAYEKAVAGFIKVTTQQFEGYLKRLAKGELLERAFIPPPPEDHTKDYNDAIEMMAWSMDSTVELTQAQFRQYVMDDWGWREQWMTSNSQYLAAGG